MGYCFACVVVFLAQVLFFLRCSRFGVRRLDCAFRLLYIGIERLSSTFAHRLHIVVVQHLDLIYLEAVDEGVA